MAFCRRRIQNRRGPVRQVSFARMDEGRDRPAALDTQIDGLDTLYEELSMSLTFLAIAPQNFDVLKVVVLRPNLDVLGSHDETPGGLARPKPTGNVLLALRLGHTCVWLSAIPAAAQTSGDSVGVN